MYGRSRAPRLFVLSALALAACGDGAPKPVTPPTASAPEPVAPAAPVAPAPRFAYPASAKEDVRDTQHGITFADPYRWLEDAASPKVREWMTAQDRFAREELAKIPEREALLRRTKELAYVEKMTVPRKAGKRYFFTRRSESQEKEALVYRDGKTGPEHVLLDPNGWSQDGSAGLKFWVPSWDGTKVAYGRSENNADHAVLYVRDIATGKDSAVDVIPGARYGQPSWTPKGDGFYYVRIPMDASIPDAERPGYAEVRFHKLGTDPKTDVLVRERSGDPTRFLAVQLSKDGRWLVVSLFNYQESDVWLKDTTKKDAPFTTLVQRNGSTYVTAPYKDRIFVLTNEGAPNRRIFAVDPKKPERASWKEVVPEQKDAALTRMEIMGGHLGLQYVKDVVHELDVLTLDGKLVRKQELPGLGSTSAYTGDPDDDDAYFTFESFTTPEEVFETSVKTGKTTSLFRPKVPGDVSKLTTEQRFARSKDGTRVPYFVVRAGDAPKNGAAPTMLTGYGGFNIARLPSFSATRLAWLEKGGVFVQAALRGGGEYGEAWHRAGMLANKQNTFDDFIGVAEDLVREGYTRPERLGILGGSNGGLLVGAAMTQRPDLFGAVVCAVPLLDMVRYTKFGSGKTWIAEYGSPDVEAQFRTLFAYSPYHHVRQGTKYPAVLLDSADSDDRVDPFHARKFAAALQDASIGGPVLLRIEKNAGHGGADLVRQAAERAADQYAFLFSVLGR